MRLLGRHLSQGRPARFSVTVRHPGVVSRLVDGTPVVASLGGGEDRAYFRISVDASAVSPALDVTSLQGEVHLLLADGAFPEPSLNLP